jgi:hypothetical protein
MQALVEGFERPFAEDFVPEEHGHKVNHLVVAEATPGKAHALTDGGKDTPRGVGAGQSGQPRRTRVCRGYRLRRGLDNQRSIGNTVQVDLLDENGFVLPHQGDIFFSCFATCYNLVAQLMGIGIMIYFNRYFAPFICL